MSHKQNPYPKNPVAYRGMNGQKAKQASMQDVLAAAQGQGKLPDDALPPLELSEAAKPLAKEAEVWNNIAFVMGKTAIPGAEASIMVECLERIQVQVDKAESALGEQLLKDNEEHLKKADEEALKRLADKALDSQVTNPESVIKSIQ